MPSRDPRSLDRRVRLAKSSIFHPGLLIIPGGGNRTEQLEYVMTAVTWAMTLNYPASAFANRCIEVSVTLADYWAGYLAALSQLIWGTFARRLWQSPCALALTL